MKVKRKLGRKKFGYGRSNKEISKKVLENKESIFTEVHTILPIFFRKFNVKNSLEKQTFAINSLFGRIGIDKELEKNKKKVVVIALALKKDKLILSEELKQYIQDKYCFRYVFDEKDIE